MARKLELEHLYNAYQDFATSCLVEDRSFLWPGRSLWTPANVTALKQALIDSPLMGQESFEAKLDVQMKGQPPEFWGLLADIYCLYCLVPQARQLKPTTRRANLTNYAQRGNLPIPDERAPIWQVIGLGFCNPGMRYQQKYRQFWLILFFAEQVKRNSERRALLNDRPSLQKLLDDCVEMAPSNGDRSTDMRHALLYLAYPDFYEGSVSSGDKEKIVAAFSQYLPGVIPEDKDEVINKIRQALEHDENFSQPLDFYHPQIKPIWKNGTPTAPRILPVSHPSPITTFPEQVMNLLQLFNFTKNIIIYGPPGTGKTYIANQAATELVKKQLQSPVPESALLRGIAEAETFYDLLAIGIYLTGKDNHYTVSDILSMPLTQARFAVRPVNNERASIWAYLQNHTIPESTTVRFTNRSEPYIFDKDTNGRWYLTSGGLEYVDLALSDTLTKLTQPVEQVGKAEDYISRVAFHQSYSYEDFVEGFRPTGANEIDIVPGIFREICARAAGNPDAKYVLIIDEINRGNISKIFGELITLLEDDKRDGQPNSFPIELAYTHLKFKVPGNLYIIGTMNTADRSIALLDVALRRRFAFYELLPEPELLRGKAIPGGDGDQLDLEKLLQILNLRIHRELGSDYQIGHSYFLKVDTLATLEFTWNNQVLPLLREYFYSQPERLAEVLGPYLKGKENTDDLKYEGGDLVAALNELTK